MAKQNAHPSKNPLKGGLIALVLGSAVMIFGCSGVMDKIKGAKDGSEDANATGTEAPANTGGETTASTTATGAMTTSTVPTEGANTTVTTDGTNTTVTTGGTTVTTTEGTATADKDEDEDKTAEADDKKAAEGTNEKDEKDADDKDEKSAVAAVKTTFTLRGGGGKVAVRGEVPRDASWTGQLKPGSHFFNVRPDNGAQKSLGVEVEAGHVNTFCYDVKKDAWCSKH